MAETCPTCLRPVATADLQAGTCTKALDGQQWRRTECLNVGIQARDTLIAENVAALKQRDELLARTRDVLVATEAGVTAALEQLDREGQS